MYVHICSNSKDCTKWDLVKLDEKDAEAENVITEPEKPTKDPKEDEKIDIEELEADPEAAFIAASKLFDDKFPFIEIVQ